MVEEHSQGERIRALEVRLDGLEGQLADANAKLDRLLNAAMMARGGWLVALRLGGLALLVLGFFGYLIDHLQFWLGLRH